MKNTIQKFTEIIHDNGLLEFKNWNVFEVDHNIDYSKKNEFLKLIEDQFKNREINGLYVYFEGEKPLYVGKGESISKRLIDHFDEAYNMRNKKRPNGRVWAEFFKHFKKNKLTIYWIELEIPEELRGEKTGELFTRTLESYIEFKIKPVFEVWKNTPEFKLWNEQGYKGPCPKIDNG